MKMADDSWNYHRHILAQNTKPCQERYVMDMSILQPTYHICESDVKLSDSPKKAHKTNRIARVEKTLISLDSFLAGRGWLINLQDDLNAAKSQIEQIERDAIEATLAQLKRAKKEADAWAANRQTDFYGKSLEISRAEQRAAAKDAAEIQKAILALTAALYGGE